MIRDIRAQITILLELRRLVRRGVFNGRRYGGALDGEVVNP